MSYPVFKTCVSVNFNMILSGKRTALQTQLDDIKLSRVFK